MKKLFGIVAAVLSLSAFADESGLLDKGSESSRNLTNIP
jgi:hypothetical protein